MQVITIFNEKGGTGKTTLTGIIGAGLAQRGHKVLLIDADGQGDLTTNMGLPKQAGFFKFVKWAEKDSPDYVDVRELVKRVPEANCAAPLYIIPGNNDSWGIPGSMSLEGLGGNLGLRLKVLQTAFAFVLFDTQPSATMLHDGLGLISDWFFCPTDAEPLSAYGGLRSTLAAIANIRAQSLARGRDKAKLLGILPNKYRAGTVLHQHIYETLTEKHGDKVFAPLPLRTSIPEAQFKQWTPTQNDPDSAYSALHDHLWPLIDRIEAATQGGQERG